MGRGAGCALAIFVGGDCEHDVREQAQLEQKREMIGGPELSVRGSWRGGWALAGPQKRKIDRTVAKERASQNMFAIDEARLRTKTLGQVNI